jgi:hypothetical protein
MSVALGTTLGPGFDATQEIALADDANRPIVGVDDRHSADPAGIM